MTAGAFIQDGAGTSCAAAGGPDGIPRTQGWTLGRDPGAEPPVFLQGSGLLRALLLVEQCVVSEHLNPLFFFIRAGTWIQDWFDAGHLRRQSTAASGIMALIYRLGIVLPCPLIVAPLPQDFFEGAEMRGARGCDLLLAALSRLYVPVLPWALRCWGARIARIPWTEDETKMVCK